MTFVHTIFIIHYLNHIAVLPPIFHHGHLPVVSSPKVSSPFFFNSSFPSHFSSWPCFWPAGDIQKHKGSQRILPTKRSEWPKALLLSWCYDLTFVGLFADRWLENIKFSSIFFDAPGLWVSLRIFSLIQSWCLCFLVMVSQSFAALSQGSLDKEPFCIFLVARMITQADCFERSLSKDKYGLN